MGTTFLSIAAVFSISIIFALGEIPGYYWRDFNGTIPGDAYAGGRDENGKPIYIGQAHYTHLVPSKIYYNDTSAYFELDGKEFRVKKAIKVLCTEHPEQFEWISTNTENVQYITNKYLIKGGHEPGCTTYIGRSLHEGEVLVGKVLTDIKPIRAGLYVTKNKTTKQYTSYEVLSYNKIRQNNTEVPQVAAV